MRKATEKLLPILKIPSPITLFSLRYSSSSCSSQSSESPFIVDYLIRTLECSKETAINASKRLHHIKSPQKPDSVISFLRSLGFSDNQVRFAVFRRPLILLSDIQSCLLPKVQLYESLGISGDELADLVSSSSACFGNSTENRLIPSLNFLRSILQNDDKRVRLALKRCPIVLAYDHTKIPSRNVEFLRNKGLDSDAIAWLVLRSPSVLLWRLDQLNSACDFAEKMGLNPGDDGFADVLNVVKSLPKEKVSGKLKILKSYGFERNDACLIFRWLPSVFRFSDQTLKKRLDFFMNEVGYDPPTFLKNSFQLSCRLEGRLLPRYRWIKNLQSKGLVRDDFNYGRMFLLPKENFVEEYVNKFKDVVGLDAVVAYKEVSRYSTKLSSEF